MNHFMFQRLQSASALLVMASLISATFMQGCGSEDRTALDLGNDAVPNQTDGVEDAPSVGQPTDTVGMEDLHVDARVEDGLDLVDAELEDGVEGSAGEDIVRPVPDVVPDVPSDVIDTCPTLSVRCSGQDGSSIASGETRLTTDFNNPITCVGSGSENEQAPTLIRWDYSYPELGQSGSEARGSLSATFMPFSVTPGPYELRYTVGFGELICTSPSFLINYEAPDGFYVELSWDDGLSRTVDNPSITDIDTHLVRNGACAEDPEGDLYYATRSSVLDWGVVGIEGDNPKYIHDVRRSPGYETAWIPEPSAGQIVHFMAHGFRMDPALGGGKVVVRYRVFIEGDVAASGGIDLGADEYVVLGAFNDGAWAPSAADASGLCPQLVAP